MKETIAVNRNNKASSEDIFFILFFVFEFGLITIYGWFGNAVFAYLLNIKDTVFKFGKDHVTNPHYYITFVSQ
jgi:hypothetical protein